MGNNGINIEQSHNIDSNRCVRIFRTAVLKYYHTPVIYTPTGHGQIDFKYQLRVTLTHCLVSLQAWNRFFEMENLLQLISKCQNVLERKKIHGKNNKLHLEFIKYFMKNNFENTVSKIFTQHVKNVFQQQINFLAPVLKTKIDKFLGNFVTSKTIGFVDLLVKDEYFINLCTKINNNYYKVFYLLFYTIVTLYYFIHISKAREYSLMFKEIYNRGVFDCLKIKRIEDFKRFELFCKHIDSIESGDSHPITSSTRLTKLLLFIRDTYHVTKQNERIENNDEKLQYIFHDHITKRIFETNKFRNLCLLRECNNSNCYEKKKKLKKCKSCRAVYYCSKACQREDWEFRHKMQCRKLRDFLMQTKKMHA